MDEKGMVCYQLTRYSAKHSILATADQRQKMAEAAGCKCIRGHKMTGPLHVRFYKGPTLTPDTPRKVRALFYRYASYHTLKVCGFGEITSYSLSDYLRRLAVHKVNRGCVQQFKGEADKMRSDG